MVGQMWGWDMGLVYGLVFDRIGFGEAERDDVVRRWGWVGVGEMGVGCLEWWTGVIKWGLSQ